MVKLFACRQKGLKKIFVLQGHLYQSQSLYLYETLIKLYQCLGLWFKCVLRYHKDN